MLCVLHNKKLNLANIFLLILKEDKIKKLYMNMCDFDSEYEALKSFLNHDSTLHKSKYIKKYLNTEYPKQQKKKRDRLRKKNL